MGLFYRWRKDAPSDWVAGEATILVSEPVGEPGSREVADSGWPLIELNYFGYRTYGLTLAVTTSVHSEYEMRDDFKVPRRAENTGLLANKVLVGLKAGLKLPVQVDPRDRDQVRIDWPAFLGDPDRKGSQDDAAQKAINRKTKEMVEADPKLRATFWANNQIAARAWAEAVRNGVMEREQLEQALDLEVECGRMDPADAEAARSSL